MQKFFYYSTIIVSLFLTSQARAQQSLPVQPYVISGEAHINLINTTGNLDHHEITITNTNVVNVVGLGVPAAAASATSRTLKLDFMIHSVTGQVRENVFITSQQGVGPRGYLYTTNIILDPNLQQLTVEELSGPTLVHRYTEKFNFKPEITYGLILTRSSQNPALDTLTIFERTIPGISPAQAFLTKTFKSMGFTAYNPVTVPSFYYVGAQGKAIFWSPSVEEM